MEEVIELFKDYKPIKSIYENEEYYIAFPQTDLEPLAVYYNKEFKEFKEIYFYEKDVSEDIINSTLIYGTPLIY